MLYAAPLKIYEYVNMGLRVISLLPNKGIDAMKQRYPELFVDTYLNSYSDDYSPEVYGKARKAFLTEAIDTNLFENWNVHPLSGNFGRTLHNAINDGRGDYKLCYFVYLKLHLYTLVQF